MGEPNLMALGQIDGLAGADLILSYHALEAARTHAEGATAYVCQRFVCQTPATDPASLAAQTSPKPQGNKLATG